MYFTFSWFYKLVILSQKFSEDSLVPGGHYIIFLILHKLPVIVNITWKLCSTSLEVKKLKFHF